MVGFPTAAPDFLSAEETAVTDVARALSQAISIINFKGSQASQGFLLLVPDRRAD